MSAIGLAAAILPLILVLTLRPTPSNWILFIAAGLLFGLLIGISSDRELVDVLIGSLACGAGAVAARFTPSRELLAAMSGLGRGMARAALPVCAATMIAWGTNSGPRWLWWLGALIGSFGALLELSVVIRWHRGTRSS